MNVNEYVSFAYTYKLKAMNDLGFLPKDILHAYYFLKALISDKAWANVEDSLKKKILADRDLRQSFDKDFNYFTSALSKDLTSGYEDIVLIEETWDEYFLKHCKYKLEKLISYLKGHKTSLRFEGKYWTVVSVITTDLKKPLYYLSNHQPFLLPVVTSLKEILNPEFGINKRSALLSDVNSEEVTDLVNRLFFHEVLVRDKNASLYVQNYLQYGTEPPVKIKTNLSARGFSYLYKRINEYRLEFGLRKRKGKSKSDFSSTLLDKRGNAMKFDSSNNIPSVTLKAKIDNCF
ncbi:MAG: hypothetical protein ACPGLV_01880 [Bacteroidia bacterium]